MNSAMVRTRQKGLLVALVLSVLYTASSVSSATAQQDEVRVAVGVDPVYTPWWIAQDKGFFAKRNLKVAIMQFSGGPDLADANMAGEQDFGASGTATYMPRFVRSDALRIVAIQATSTASFKLLASTSIKTLEDLKGKKLGTVGGSSTDYLWSLVEKKIGVPEGSLNLVSVPPPELVPAFDRGDIQAFFSWEPWPSRALQVSGKAKAHVIASSGDVGYFLNFIVVGNKNFIESKPDATARVLAALRDSIDEMNKNPAEAVRIGAERNKQPVEMAEYMMNLFKFEFDVADQKLAESTKVEEAWMRSKNRLRGDPVDWNRVIDRRYYDLAIKIK